MTFVKTFQRNIRTHHVISGIAIIVLLYAIYQYSNRKGTPSDGFGAGQYKQQPQQQAGGMSGGASQQPVGSSGRDEEYASVSGVATSSYGLPPSCSKGNTIEDPSELLPKDNNSQWAQLNPSGSGDLKNVNLLKAGYHTGIDTIGSSLRNANLQVRSEPPNPTTKVSPWSNTTIEPDLMRVPLEIGCGSQ